MQIRHKSFLFESSYQNIVRVKSISKNILRGERRDFGNASHSATWRTGSLGDVKVLSLIVKSNMTGKCIFRGSSFQGFIFSRSAPTMVALT